LDFDIDGCRAISPGGVMAEIEQFWRKRKQRRESVDIRLDEIEPRLTDIRQVA